MYPSSDSIHIPSDRHADGPSGLSHMSDRTLRPRLSVLVCTYGEEGIRRVAEADYPVIEGVRYLVSWQLPEGDPVIPPALNRPDVHVEVSRTRGLSVNRNLSLKMATGEYSLIADDDVRYIPQYFENLFKAFEEWPDADFITFTYESKYFPKSFPSYGFDLRHPARGYYTTSFEIAFRTDAVVEKLKFNTNFGIGARWPSGEEDVFMNDAKRAGFNMRFVPLPIARHDGSTTSDREGEKPLYFETKGAVFRILFPVSWPLRMISHLRVKPKRMSVITFLKSWLKGAFYSRRNR